MKKKRDFYTVAKEGIQLQTKHQLSDDEMSGLIPSLIEKRDASFRKQLVQYYGKELYRESLKWWRDLSAKERRVTKAEDDREIIRAFIANNPEKVDSKIIKKATREKIKNPTYDSLPSEDVDLDESGKVVFAKKIKIQKKPPRQPSPQELRKMSIKEVASLIAQTRDALWPSGGGGEEIVGIDGISSE